MRWRSIIPAAAVMLCFSATAKAGVLSPFTTVYNTDWTVSAMGGMRTDGVGTLNVSGISGTVTSAYLYWHGPTGSSDPGSNANVTFNGNAITGTNIGTSHDNFWSDPVTFERYLNSQAYRADVTAFVTGNGNYSLSDFINPLADTSGVSLVTYFDDGDNTNNRDVVTFDGNDSNVGFVSDPFGWAAVLNGINYSSGTASLVFGVSDGQRFFDEQQAYLNGTPVFPDIDQFDGTHAQDAGGSDFPDSIGFDGIEGLLWDVRTYDITSFLSPGINNFALTTDDFPGDALSLVHLHFDLPAAPVADIPEPSSLTLLGLGVAGWWGYSRRKARKLPQA
jgi:hypothetical protein